MRSPSAFANAWRKLSVGPRQWPACAKCGIADCPRSAGNSPSPWRPITSSACPSCSSSLLHDCPACCPSSAAVHALSPHGTATALYPLPLLMTCPGAGQAASSAVFQQPARYAYPRVKRRFLARRRTSSIGTASLCIVAVIDGSTWARIGVQNLDFQNLSTLC
jgi:hypothetical protein